LEQANLTVTYAEGPSLVRDHAFTTGQIGLRSFEKVLSPSAMKIGIEDGIGCYPLLQDEQTKCKVGSGPKSATGISPRNGKLRATKVKLVD
jgi:7,8-dihydropterin-6-yl-methyl-4-(beta-D-ribofuranosyl)aminobenzene 5'-phosphate synthase